MARGRPKIDLRRSGKGGRETRNRQAAPRREKKSRFADTDWGKVRLWGVGLAFGVLWLLLWTRAFHLQVMLGPRYAEEARRAQSVKEMAMGRRGSILDRNGNVLAQSVESRSVGVWPGRLEDKRAAAEVLRRTLGLDAARADKVVNDKRAFVWAARKIDPRAAEEIREARIRGLELIREYERAYPYKHMAGQLLGFVNIDDKGIEGLELAFNDTLSGQRRQRELQRDAAGRRLYSGLEAPLAVEGDDVTLTLDTQVQYFAESALMQGVDSFGARWAACLVVDVPSGDILAWAEYPFFNPNRPGAFSPFIRRNKTAMDALEQGSTVKPFLMAAALQENIITPDSAYNCENGQWRLRNVTIRDTSNQGVLPARDILKVSSNIGVAKIGLDLGAAKYHAYLSRLGFGAKTGLPLAGENKGIVHPARQWTEVDLASASFGQSFSATILQMAQAYLCLANDGMKKELRLVAGQKQPESQQRIFSSEVMAQVRDMLRGAVEDRGGTGRRARIDGLLVGGKTGTAQKASGDAYGAGRVASFVGMVPVEQPRYLVMVMLDEPVKNQYGGTVAAPIFKNVALQTMAYHGLLPESPVAQALADLEVETRALAAGENVAPGPALVDVADSAPQAGKVPSVVGMTVRGAVETFARHGVVPSIRGEGVVVVRQSPEPGAPMSRGEGQADCTLWLGDRS